MPVQVTQTAKEAALEALRRKRGQLAITIKEISEHEGDRSALVTMALEQLDGISRAQDELFAAYVGEVVTSFTAALKATQKDVQFLKNRAPFI